MKKGYLHSFKVPKSSEVLPLQYNKLVPDVSWRLEEDKGLYYLLHSRQHELHASLGSPCLPSPIGTT